MEEEGPLPEPTIDDPEISSTPESVDDSIDGPAGEPAELDPENTPEETSEEPVDSIENDEGPAPDPEIESTKE
jgi:hypothetical protein